MANDRIVLNLTDDDLTEQKFTPAPAGWYPVEIEEIETRESKSAKNPGKPFYSIKFKSVDEDRFKGRFFDNVMLWQGAHYDIVAIGKALGLIESAGDFSIPTEDELLGKELEVRVVIEKYTNRDDEEAERNAVKGYRGLEAGKTAAKGKAKPKAGAKAGFKL